LHRVASGLSEPLKNLNILDLLEAQDVGIEFSDCFYNGIEMRFLLF